MRWKQPSLQPHRRRSSITDEDFAVEDGHDFPDVVIFYAIIFFAFMIFYAISPSVNFYHTKIQFQSFLQGDIKERHHEVYCKPRKSNSLCKHILILYTRKYPLRGYLLAPPKRQKRITRRENITLLGP